MKLSAELKRQSEMQRKVRQSQCFITSAEARQQYLRVERQSAARMTTPTVVQNLSLYHTHRHHQLELAARVMRIRQKQKRREIRKVSRRLLWLRIKWAIRSMFKVG